MKLLVTITDKDFFGAIAKEPVNLDTVRRVVRAVLLDDEKRIALVGRKDFVLLPGGGVEVGENLEESLSRECIEEAGCAIEVLKEVGQTDDMRQGGKQETYCYVARVVGEKGNPTSTQQGEIESETLWVPPQEAIHILEEQLRKMSLDRYHSLFNTKHCLEFLKEFIL